MTKSSQMHIVVQSPGSSNKIGSKVICISDLI